MLSSTELFISWGSTIVVFSNRLPGEKKGALSVEVLIQGRITSKVLESNYYIIKDEFITLYNQLFESLFYSVSMV